jgi:hypothetical protein
MLRAMLHGFDYSNFLKGGHKLLAGAANYVLADKDGKKRWADHALAMSKAFSSAAHSMKQRQCEKKSPSSKLSKCC